MGIVFYLPSASIQVNKKKLLYALAAILVIPMTYGNCKHTSTKYISFIIIRQRNVKELLHQSTP